MNSYDNLHQADDQNVTFSVRFAEGWLEVPLELSESAVDWATRTLTSQHPDQPVHSMRSGIRHLAATIRMLPGAVLPGTETAVVCQPDPAGPVLGVMAIGFALPEMFPGDPSDEIRRLERRGVEVGQVERTTITLPLGAAARVRSTVAQRRSGLGRWRGDVLTESVLYFCKPPMEGVRVIVDAWWQLLDLGDELASHVDLMVETLGVVAEA